MGKTFSFVSGALFGAAAGAIVGVALAPRSGAETRAMAADIANDAGTICATPTSTAPRRPVLR